jgi:hypothetical protein
MNQQIKFLPESKSVLFEKCQSREFKTLIVTSKFKLNLLKNYQNAAVILETFLTSDLSFLLYMSILFNY